MTIPFNAARRVVRLCTNYDVPSYVKNAAVEDLIGEGQDDSVFVDRASRRLPYHTKAATAVSYLEFRDNPDQFASLPKSAAMGLVRAIHLYGVKNDIDRLFVTKAASTAKTKYAFVDTINGQVVERLPLRSNEEAVAAAKYLCKHAASFSTKQRFQTAGRILEFREVLDEPQIVKLEKMAGIGETPGVELADVLIDISDAVPDDVDRKALVKVADTVYAYNSVRGELLQHVTASVVDLAERYNIPVEHERLVTYSGTMFKQADANRVVLANGFTYSAADINSISDETLLGLLGQDVFDNLRPVGIKSAAMTKSAAAKLTEKQANMLVTALKMAGVKPVDRPVAPRLSLSRLVEV